MKGKSALESRRSSGRPKCVRTPTNGLSSMGSYAGEIPQSVIKAKNAKRIEGHIEVDMEVDMVALKFMWEDLPLEPINKDIKALQKDSEHVWILVVDTLNSSCETTIKFV